MAGEGLTLILKTHDSSRVADVVLPGDMSPDQVVGACVERWKLPPDRDYSLYCERLGRQLDPRTSLAQAGIRAGDELVVHPLLEAGCGSQGRRP